MRSVGSGRVGSGFEGLGEGLGIAVEALGSLPARGRAEGRLRPASGLASTAAYGPGPHAVLPVHTGLSAGCLHL